MPRVLIENCLRRRGVVECYVKAVMKIYQEVLSQVKVEGEDSKEFVLRVGIRQGSILSPFSGCGDRRGGEGGTCLAVCR